MFCSDRPYIIYPESSNNDIIPMTSNMGDVKYSKTTGT